MKKNKKFWPAMLILALVFGTAIIGCDNGTSAGSNNGGNSGSAGGPADITYTVEANGKADTETSSQLTFTFSAAVSDLEVGDIKIIEGTGKAAINVSIKDNLTGNDKIWSLSIIRITAGKIRVQITKDGIERGRKTLLVHQNTSPALTKEDAIKLTGGLWEDKSIADGETRWYKFEAESGVSYSMQYKDGFNKSAGEDYTGWIEVTALQSDGTTEIPTTGSGNPREISGVSGTVYLKVTPYRGLGGTFAIRFYDIASMPQVIIKVDPSASATIIPFVAVKWYVQAQSNEISESEVKGFRVYRSNTQTGKYTQIGEDFITEFTLNSYAFYDSEKIIYYDRNVTPGNTYWYKVAAFNNNNMEGDMSDPSQSEEVPGPTEPLPLTIGEKIDSTMDTAPQVVWYKFEADSAKTYRVQWESFTDNHIGGWENEYAFIIVSAFTNDRELVNFTEKYRSGSTDGWETPGTVSGVSGTVYLKVEVEENSRTGLYNIKVYEE